MVASMLLFETDFVNIVAIAFTATILNELVMVSLFKFVRLEENSESLLQHEQKVAVEVTTWHPLMVAAEVGSFLLYAASIAFLPQYFGMLLSGLAIHRAFQTTDEKTQTSVSCCPCGSYGKCLSLSVGLHSTSFPQSSHRQDYLADLF